MKAKSSIFKSRVLPAIVLIASTWSSIISCAGLIVQAQTSGPGVKGEAPRKVNQWPSGDKRYALVIGVSEYADERIYSLIAPSNDADMLAEALVNYAGFPEDHVIVLTTKETKERQPIRNIILEYVFRLARLAGSDGLLLLAFSGHGYEIGGQAFLLGSDARFVPDLNVMKETAVSWTKILEAINEADVAQVIMLLDACRNDPGSAKGTGKPNKITQIYARGLRISEGKSQVKASAKFFATQQGEQAYEDVAKKQGFFMSAVVDALKGEAADSEGKVTLGQLRRYVEAKVPARAKLNGMEQKPKAEIAYYDEDQLVIAILHKSAPNTQANVIAPAIDPARSELIFWESIKDSKNPEDFKAYLRKYPKGEFTELAENRLKYFEAPAKPVPPVESAPLNAEPDSGLTAAPDALNARKGNELLGKEKFREAEAQFREAIKLAPDKAAYHSSLGIALYNQGKFEEAEAEYKKAIKLDPYKAEVHFNLGLALFRRQKFANAESALKKAIKLNPNDASFHSSLCMTLAFRERLIEAETECREAIRLEPNKAPHHHALANILLGRNKIAQAESEYRMAVQLDPNNNLYKESLRQLLNQR